MSKGFERSRVLIQFIIRRHLTFQADTMRRAKDRKGKEAQCMKPDAAKRQICRTELQKKISYVSIFTSVSASNPMEMSEAPGGVCGTSDVEGMGVLELVSAAAGMVEDFSSMMGEDRGELNRKGALVISGWRRCLFLGGER